MDQHPTPQPKIIVKSKKPGLWDKIRSIKVSRVQWKKIRKTARTIRVWVITLTVVCIAVLLVRFTVREINDTSFKIQTLRVPSSLSDRGYDGVSVTYIMLDHLRHILTEANKLRTFGKNEFRQASEQIDTKIEIAGIGLSPESVAHYVKQSFNITTKSIGGEIIRNDSLLLFNIRMTGFPSTTLKRKLTPHENIDDALQNLLVDGAQHILQSINPSLLANYFLINDSGLRYEPSKIEAAIRSAIKLNPNDPTPYIQWAFLGQAKTPPDTSFIFSKLRDALAIDPDNTLAYRFLGTFYFDSGQKEKGLAYLNKAYESDSSGSGLNFVMARYSLAYHKDYKKSLRYAEQAYQIDSSLSFVNVLLAKLYFMDGNYKKAKYHVGKSIMFNGTSIDPRSAEAMIYESVINYSQNGPSSGKSCLNNLQTSFDIDNKIIAPFLNNVAYDLATNCDFLSPSAEDQKRKVLDAAMFLVDESLDRDSVSVRSGFTYSTKAEISWWLNDKSNARNALTKAVDRGFNIQTSKESELYKKILQ